jgi:hypothetical protein
MIRRFFILGSTTEDTVDCICINDSSAGIKDNVQYLSHISDQQHNSGRNER